MEFDPTKPVQTRDGRKAEVLKTGLKHPTESIAAIVTDHDGSERIKSYTVNGRFFADGSNATWDLLNIPEVFPLTPEELPLMAGRVIVDKESGVRSVVLSSGDRYAVWGKAKFEVQQGAKHLLKNYTHPDGSAICSGSLD